MPRDNPHGPTGAGPGHYTADPQGVLKGRAKKYIATRRTARTRVVPHRKNRYYNRAIPWPDPEPGREEYLRLGDVPGLYLDPVLDLWIPYHRKVYTVRGKERVHDTWQIVSGNTIRTGHWRVQVRYKQKAHKAFEHAMFEAGRLPAKRCPKQFSVVRITSQRSRRILDVGNLSWGAKPLEDCLSWRHCEGWGLIADDSETWAHIQLEQISGAKGEGLEYGTRVEVWHLRRRRARGR